MCWEGIYIWLFCKLGEVIYLEIMYASMDRGYEADKDNIYVMIDCVILSLLFGMCVVSL